jgi:ABC-type transport system involved in multi-copper enzyme maturation permease subunit
MIPQDVGKVAVDMVLSAVSFTGLLLVLFIGINLLSKDLDRRTIYVVLSKQISRPQYVVGKFTGMAMLILATLFMLSLFAVVSLFTLKMIYPTSFQSFSWLSVLLALLFITLMLNMLSAISFLFASLTSSSFTTLILTIISYIIGQSLTAVKAIVEAPQAVGIHVSPISVKVVQFAYYLFPNLSLFDIKTQAAHGLSIPFPYIFWTVSYGVVYTCLVVTLAALIFRKKEFS